jgi:hypothetical protein
MEVKYVALGVFMTFVVLALMASNVGEFVKDSWSSLWCLGSSNDVDEFGWSKKEQCVESVSNSTQVGSSICIVLLATGLIAYVVRERS